jgi:hypothetical protein
MVVIESLLAVNRLGYFCLFWLVPGFFLWKRHRLKASIVLETMNVLVAVCGIMSFLLVASDFITANSEEKTALLNRKIGLYGWIFRVTITITMLLPQVFWFKKLRQNLLLSFAILIFVIINPIDIESAITIVASFHRDYLPSGWNMNVNSVSTPVLIPVSFEFYWLNFRWLLFFGNILLYLGMLALTYLVLRQAKIFPSKSRFTGFKDFRD